MKLFIAKGYHLAALPVPAKLVYSLFLVFIAIGLWTSWAMYRDRIGADLQGPVGQPSVQERYVNRAAQPSQAGVGPALDLDEPAAPKPTEDLKKPWVMDVFHSHVFSVSVVYLILAHLFMLTRLHPVASGGVIALAGLSALLHVLAPVIIWKTGTWLWLMPVSGASMGLSWTAMVAYTLLAMWFGNARANQPQA